MNGGSLTRLFDNTRYEAYDRCEQEGVYAHQENLRAAKPDKSPFFGQVVHEGVRAFYDDKTLPECLDTTVAYWARHAPTFDPADKPHLNLAYAQDLVRLYALIYPRDAWDFEVVLNEQYIANPESEECAIVDRVVRWKRDGQLYAKDLKTTGLFIGAPFQQSFENNQQVAIQLDTAEVKLGEPLAGFIFDGIFLTSRKAGPQESDFVRYGPISYTPLLRQELRQHRRAKRARIKELEQAPSTAEKRTKNCFRFNSLCPFFKFCKADLPDRQDMIALDLATGSLVQKVWNPARRDET